MKTEMSLYNLENLISQLSSNSEACDVTLELEDETHVKVIHVLIHNVQFIVYQLLGIEDQIQEFEGNKKDLQAVTILKKSSEVLDILASNKLNLKLTFDIRHSSGRGLVLQMLIFLRQGEVLLKQKNNFGTFFNHTQAVNIKLGSLRAQRNHFFF